jgi:hypothetical protein
MSSSDCSPSPSLNLAQSRIHPDLLEKQQEHLALRQLLEASSALTQRAEALADQGDVMADGGAGTSRTIRAGRVPGLSKEGDEIS